MSIRGLILAAFLSACATCVCAQQWCVRVRSSSVAISAEFPTYMIAPPFQPKVPSTYSIRFYRKPGVALWAHDSFPEGSFERWLAKNTMFSSPGPFNDTTSIRCSYEITKRTSSLTLDSIQTGSCFDVVTTDPQDIDSNIPDEAWVPVVREPSFDYAVLRRNAVFPEVAKLWGIEGLVFISVLLSDNGSISRAFVLDSDSPYLQDAAMTAVLRTSYTPAYNDVGPIKCWVRIPVRFQLR